MARPYRTTATLVTRPTEEGDDTYAMVEGFTLSWLPGQGPFPLVLEHGKEYHLCQRGGKWIMRARIAAPEPSIDPGPDG